MNDNENVDFEENISMDELLAASSEIETGEILTGLVVSVDAEYVYVNTGTKTEGRVPIAEFQTVPKSGESIKVLQINKRGGEGFSRLSHKQALHAEQWKNFAENDYSEGNIVEASIDEVRPNGAIVDFGVFRGFLPLSHAADIRLKEAVKSEDKYEMKIIKIDSRKKSVILSRRIHLDSIRDASWANLLSSVNEGDVVPGEVVRIANFGAFIDLGGFEALLHNNDLSWRKVSFAKDFYKPGDKGSFKILTINNVEKKISLGVKQLKSDPWLTLETKYSVGTEYQGVVTGAPHFGVFVELEEGVEGLVPLDELQWKKKTVAPKSLFTKGDTVAVKIININSNERTLTLSIKQTIDNPWKAIAKKYPMNAIVTGKIKSKLDFGIFVELEEGIDAFIHVSEITWDDTVKNPLNAYKEGDSVECKILSVNIDEMKISAGIKQLEKSPWELVREKYPLRSLVKGVISSIKSFGVFVKLDDDLEGLIHISEVSKNKVENLDDFFKEGDSVEAVVLDVDVKKKKISLSIKNIELRAEKEELNKILNAQSSSTATIGDLIKIKGDKANDE